ncbi:MAG: siphovirus Gp157 family protein [Citrobacter sp.]|uniref:siphovirus Gp157 family protein n=1 Tax=Citrobacter sp. TaxID=1896336 RepID=UPI00290D5F71|nr:siphovirus Gp157 family protein [Citrobacter sp.]MDU7777464.1 siphovirus Gp157 family protein [Citrobacter sp.]
MSSIYELTDQWKEVEGMLYDGETDEQIILDTLESIDGEIEQKADNYAKLIKNMEADIETLSKEEKTRFKTALFSFSVANNGGRQPFSITDNLDEIPGKYLIPQDPKVNMDAVRELLQEKEVEWAHLEPYGKHLKIR